MIESYELGFVIVEVGRILAREDEDEAGLSRTWEGKSTSGRKKFAERGETRNGGMRNRPQVEEKEILPMRCSGSLVPNIIISRSHTVRVGRRVEGTRDNMIRRGRGSAHAVEGKGGEGDGRRTLEEEGTGGDGSAR